MRKCILPVICLLIAHAVHAQVPKPEDSVKAAVNQLFISMATSDSAGVRGAFAEGGMLQTVNEKDGKTTVVTDNLSDFAHLIGSLQKGDADEQIKFNTIKIDGPLAFVWAPYNFFFKGKFSHCGIDCFCIVRLNSEWKIQYLIDTRTTKGCRY